MAKKDDEFSWFDLSKYDSVKDFDITDWHYQLSQRLLIDKFFGVSSLKSLNTAVKESIALIKANPILKYDKPKLMGLTVRDTSYVDLLMASHDDKRLKDIGAIPEMEILDEVGKTSVRSEYFFGEAGLNKALLTIDCGAADKQLINDFKEWLKNHRAITKYTSKPNIFTPKGFERWHKNNYLPYLDLTLITKFEGKKLTNPQLGRLLFPDDYDHDLGERIRNTVENQAKSLISA